jgi:serine/threonine protein kinase
MLCQKDHRYPFWAESRKEIKQRIIDEDDHPQPLPSDYSDLLRNLISKCMSKDYSKRPTIQEMLSLFGPGPDKFMVLEPWNDFMLSSMEAASF